MFDQHEVRAIQIFKSGSHGAMNGERLSFSDADVALSAVSYDAKRAPASLVLGHPTGVANSLGRVLTLVAEGGALFAVAEVSKTLINLVRSGRYKNVSASFHMPTSKANPVPGTFYLIHVGFLGASSPAVRGMQPISFGEPDSVVEFAEAVPRYRGHRHQVCAAASEVVRALPNLQFINVADQIIRATQSRRHYK